LPVDDIVDHTSIWPTDEPVYRPHMKLGANDIAVIVAIETYTSTSVGPVVGANDTGIAWEDYLENGRGVPFDRIKRLNDSEASKGSIEKALLNAAENALPDARIWFIFIGHGAPSVDGTGGLLLGADTIRTPDSVAERGVRHTDVIQILEQSKATPIVIFDACFSGLTSTGEPFLEGLQPATLVTIEEPKRATILAASTGYQYTGQLPELKRPAFSYLLLGALRGWGDLNHDGEVSIEEAVGFTNSVTSKMVDGRSQNAKVFGDGDIVLGLSGGEPTPNFGELSRTLGRARRPLEVASSPPDAPNSGPVDGANTGPQAKAEPEDDGRAPARDRRKTALLASGGTLLGLSSVGIATLITGLVAVNQAEQNFQTGSALQDRLDANAAGAQADKLVITGAALTGVLVSGGLVLLLVGKLRKSKTSRSISFLPTVGPSNVGFSLRGGF